MRREAVLAAWALGVSIAFAWASSARAIDIEKMVMPGQLAKAHAELEQDCSSCHQAFDAKAQRALCLKCHEEVAADVARKQGFHGRNAIASAGQCSSCHPDHRGREADIRAAGDSTFDHAQTDFPLRGRHESVACTGCHPAGKARREAPSDCHGCHAQDDKHGDALPNDCAKCHQQTSWATGDFDHARTKYPLTGAHAKAACDGCHGGERYAGTPTECIACHAIDDKHAGGFGTRCNECHDTRRWQKQAFDHAKASGFALVGVHASAACASCHREPPGKNAKKLPKTCVGCHASDDVHAGRYGNECQSCHQPQRWSAARFDHARTQFPLKGAHDRLSCNACHTKSVAGQRLPTRCEGCHLRDDVHEGALGKDCAECHDVDSFTARVRFDHDLTKFPLLGLHATVACEACHADHRFQQSDLACRTCHAADDVHKRAMGNRCERCHNPNGWDRWKFDHAAETKFALRGAHESLACAACHRAPIGAGVQMAKRCVDCHAKRDPHRGEFGRQCESCHGEKAWRPATFGRGGVRR